MTSLRDQVEDYYDDEGRLHLPKNENFAKTLSKSDVTNVTGVTTSNDEASGCNVNEKSDVTNVTNCKIPPLKDRPRYLILNDWLEEGGNKYRPGVWYFGIKTRKEGGGDVQIPTETWICSPIHIDAITHDKDLNNFGRLLRFKTSINTWRAWPLPMEMLKGGGEEMRGALLSMGVEIDPTSRNQLSNYIQSQHPEKRINCVTKTGWCNDSFVLPGEVIGKDKDSIIYQSNTSFFDEYTQAGTFDGWQELPSLAVGNPMLIVALSSSFAGAMLDKCGLDGGGIHFFGDSSTGKTTLLDAARSVWGGKAYRRSWKATANGIEGAASLFNDNLLCLDEVSECDPQEVGKIVYSLGNGYGKQRANRNGEAKGLTRWKCFIISNGERTIETSIKESGRTVKAGQSVRLLDIPATRKHGAFDVLHGLPNGAALSDKIKSIASSHYGHAGRAFLEKLTRDGRDFKKYLEQFKSLPALKGDDDSGQFKRVAARFALVALAGELATEYDLTGWNEGAALNASVEGLRAWQSMRGKGNSEKHQILERIEDLISRHGDSRFSNADSPNYDNLLMIRDRAGWWRDNDGTRVYLFTSSGLREALKGFDFNRALDVLQEAGALQVPESGKERAKSTRINIGVKKLYHIHLMEG
jgi:putative DNA primase/helicase